MGRLLLFLLAPAISLAAQDPAPSGAETHSSIQVTLEFIEVPAAEAIRLLSVEHLGADGEKLREKLQTLLDQGTATQLESTLVSTTSGQKGTSSTGREVIYPSEWSGRSSLPYAVPAPEEAKNHPTPPLIYPPIPTAFTTRNLGNTLEVSSGVSANHRSVELDLLPDLVMDSGSGRWPLRKGEPVIEAPWFYSLRAHSTLVCQDGEPALLTLLTPMGRTGSTNREHKLFVIVTADILASASPAK